MIDWRAVGAGAAVALAVVVATLALVAAVDRAVGLGPESNWVFVFYALALGGLVAGGRLAARRAATAPLPHGLLAALMAYAAVALVAVVVRAATDRGLDPVALGFNALMAASAGIVGTLLAERGGAPPRRS